MKNTANKKLMSGALVLSLSAIVAKILSAVYRVPLQNLVGNTGFYVYQQIYPIYGIGMTFALNGFPIFISKVIAQQSDEKQQRVVSKYLILILNVFSLLCLLLLFGGSALIAHLMGDDQLTPLIKMVATMFIFMPILAAGRGYFQGRFDMLPTAKSQVLEQIVRVGMIVAVAFISVDAHWPVYKMGTWAIASSTVAAIFASLFFIKWFYDILKLNIKINWNKMCLLTKRFLIEGGILCLISAMILLLQLVDSFTVKNGLVMAGMSPDVAKATKGIYDRAQPLVQLGNVLAVSFATTLLPALTQALKKHDEKQFFSASSLLVKVGLTIAIPACLGMLVIMPELNWLLFGNEAGSAALSIYNISIIFASVIFVYNSILQSVDNIAVIFKAIMAGLIFKVIFNAWAVQKWQINGASMITVLSLAIIALIMHQSISTDIKRWIYHKNHFGMKLILGNGFMVGLALLASWIVQHLILINTRAYAGLFILIVMSVGILSYGVFIFNSNMFNNDELVQLPLGDKLVRLRRGK